MRFRIVMITKFLVMAGAVLVHSFLQHRSFQSQLTRVFRIDKGGRFLYDDPTKSIGFLFAQSSRASPHRKTRRKHRSFAEYLPKLQAFYVQHGHSNVTANQDDDLYAWTKSIRNQYRTKLHTLSNKRKEALNDLDFSWFFTSPNTNGVKTRRWHDYYPKLRQYHEKYGHCNVTEEQDPDLHRWIVSLRLRFGSSVAAFRRLEGTSSAKLPARSFTKEQLATLDDLGFCWQPNPKNTKAKNYTNPNRTRRKRQKSWEDYFPRLEVFHQQHGHCNVTSTDDGDLYKWITSLRRNHRWQAALRCLEHSQISPKSYERNVHNSSSRPRLTDAQFDALKDLNFSWFASGDSSTTNHSKRMTRKVMWDEFFPRLQQFYNDHGHANVGASEENKDLARWVSSLNRHQLSEDQIQILQLLGIPLKHKPEFERLSARQEMVDKLKIFFEKHGHYHVDASHDPELNQWMKKYVLIYGHRYLMRLVLPQAQAKKRSEARFEAMVERLAIFRRRNGHCRVTRSDGDYKLYNFVQRQRREYRKLVNGQPSWLNDDRVEILENIGMEWGKSHEIRWKERMEELRVFQQSHGHVEVPQQFSRNPQLGNWVMNQRTMKRLNDLGIHTRLRGSRIEKLEDINFVWNVNKREWWDMFESLKTYQAKNGSLKIDPEDADFQDLRKWLNMQRHFYRTEKFKHLLTQERVEALESLPGFTWRGRSSTVPTKSDWKELMDAIREKGIDRKGKVKTHWFDGVNPFSQETKTVWTDEDLMALWNEELDMDEDDEEYYFEDEDSATVLRA